MTTRPRGPGNGWWLVARALVAVLAATAFLALAGTAVLAEGSSDAARIQANGVFSYDGETKTVTASGDVRVTYKDIVIQADRLRADLDRNLVFAEGHVVYTKGNDRVEAANLTFDLKKEHGEFNQIRTTYTGSSVKGKLYVTANDMDSANKVTKLMGGSLTTCDLAKPHYHLETSEIIIYVDDRLIARRVAYFEGRYKLFTLPYVIIPLKKENQFELPRIGYSSTDGWFIKTTYNYYRNPRFSGSYYLDWYQLKGFGTGFTHNYDNGRAENEPNYQGGTAYVYGKQNREVAPDLYLKLDHTVKLPNGWSGSVGARYDSVHPTPDQDQVTANSTVRLTQQGESGRTDLSVFYQTRLTDWLSFSEGEVVSRELDLRDMRATFNTTQKLSPIWSYSLATSATRYFEVGKTPYDTVGYQAQVLKDFEDLTVRLNKQEQFNPPPPSSEDEEQVLWKSYSRTEVVAETKRISVSGRTAPLQAVATVGQYSERQVGVPGIVLAKRGDLTLRLTGLNYNLTPKISTNLTGSTSATYYESGDYRLSAATGTGVTYRFADGWSANARYNWQDGLGASPLYSLAVAPNEVVTGSLNYAKDGLTADISSGYNLLTEKYQDVNARMGITRGSLAANASIGYDLNRETPRKFSGTVQYKPNETLQVQVGTVYDFEMERFERADALVGLPLAKLWRLDIAGSLDTTQDRLTRAEVVLTRDLHCREVKLRYDEVRREIWLELRIKALPAQAFRLGANEGRMMFDPQGLGELFPTSGTAR